MGRGVASRRVVNDADTRARNARVPRAILTNIEVVTIAGDSPK